MKTILPESTITIWYEGKLDNGEIFVSVSSDNPQTLRLGNQEMPPSVENSLIGLHPGETKTVRVSPEEGYGPRQKLLLQTLTRHNFGEKVSPQPGMILALKIEKDGKEHQIPATVLEVTEDSVIVDYNHPLAGHFLTYTITILNIADEPQ